jgi:hypothetical protein
MKKKKKREGKKKKAQSANWTSPQSKISHRGTRRVLIRAARGRHIGFPR